MGLRKKEPAVFIIVILIFGVLLYFVAYPLYAVFRESVMNDAGKFIGPANYIQFIQSAYFRQVFYNTLIISVIATAGAVIIGTIFAYGMTRTGLSVILSSIGAFFATILGLLIAYLLVCRNFLGRKAMDFLGTLPYAVPGTMMGLGFVVAFNQAPLILTGTAFIIVLDYAIRRMPFGLRSGVSTLKQIDVAREEASADLGAPWFTPFRKIVLPLMKPAFIAGITFAFIRAITELTSTIFRVTPRWRVMAVDIYNMVESGALGGAAAMSTLLMAIVVIILLIIYRATGATASMFRM
jgi:ABC-type Fe3+ transport system permease subunit